MQTICKRTVVKFKMIRPNYRNFRNFKFVLIQERCLEHSAKGSTWEEHKYIKRVDGTYYYPDSYEGGRHLSDLDKSEKTSNDSSISKLENMTGMTRESLLELRELSRKDGYDSAEFKEMLSVLSEGDPDRAEKIINVLKQEESGISLSSNDIENLAMEVIRGNFGNGQERKDLLGENYVEIQKRVNELIKRSTGSKKVSEASEESVKKAEAVAKKVSTPTSSSKIHSGVNMDEVMRVYKKK